MLTDIFNDPAHEGRLAGITYHCWWPSSSDPMYLYNVSENAQRVNYYGADYTPHAYFDGDVDGQYFTSNWDNQITSEEGVDSPIQVNLNIDHDHASNSGTVEAVISATETISYSNLRLRIAVTESHIPDVPGGSYFDEHNHCMRDMLPDATGNNVTISKGDVVRITEPYTLDLGTEVWDNLEMSAFVQSDNGHRVLQAATQTFPGPHVSISPAGTSVQVARGGTLSFDAFLSNTTNNAARGDLWLTVILPSGSEIEVPEANLHNSNPRSGTHPARGPGVASGPTRRYQARGPVGPCPVARRAQDEDVARELWEASEALVGPFFR